MISFIVTAVSLLLLRPISPNLKLIDYPNDRKKHEGNIPLIGGICIFIGVLISQMYLSKANATINMVIISSLLILILGICDDIINLKAKRKLYFQIIIVTGTIYFTEIEIKTLGYLFFSSYSLELGILSIPFTIIAIVGLMNAFNMIDGVDGQTGSLVLVAIMGLFFLNFDILGHEFYNIILSIFAGLIPFLIFNVLLKKNLKVFLGDGGSLFLGFIIAINLIYSSQNSNIITPRFTLWCVAVPLFDFFCVVFLRKIKKRPLLKASTDHIHHFIASFGLPNKYVFLVTTLIGIVMLMLGYFLETNFPFISFFIYIILFLAYCSLRYFWDRRKKYY